MKSPLVSLCFSICGAEENIRTLSSSLAKTRKDFIKRAEAFWVLWYQAFFYWFNSLADSQGTNEIKRLASFMLSLRLTLSRVTYVKLARESIYPLSCVTSFLSCLGQDGTRDELKILTGRPQETVACNCRPDHFEASGFLQRSSCL